MSGLKEKLLASKKYRDVCPDTIERIWSECSAKYKKEKDVDKAAREALHGVTGAFMTEREYKRAMELAAAREGEALLEMHASTRERLPIARMNETFDRIFAITGRPESVLDLACGLNPVYLAQRLPGAELLGVDISGQCVRIVFDGGSYVEPIVSEMVLELGAPVSILRADIRQIQGRSIGQMIVRLPQSEDSAQRAIRYLRDRNLTVEEVEESDVC